MTNIILTVFALICIAGLCLFFLEVHNAPYLNEDEEELK